MNSLAVKVKTLRKKNGLTLEQLANMCSCTKSHIWEIEQGKTIRPSAQLIYNLAGALETSFEHLIGQKKTDGLSDNETVMLRKYRSLDKRGRDTAERLINAL